MSQKKSLAERVLKFSKSPNQYLTNYRISSPLRTRIHQRPAQSNTIPHHPGESRIFRRLFHRPASFSPDILKLPIGEGLIDRIRGFDIVKDRIRWDGLSPPPMVMEEVAAEEGLTAEDARKLLKVAQLEGLKLRLREMEKTWISYSEFVRVCSEGCSDLEYGVRVARNLDESGTVVVLGNLVLLKPEQVLKAIGGLIPLPAADPNDPRRKELQEMEKQKAVIDQKAGTLVRRELWCGLGFLILQTAGFMRLTFWELTWDVMEPICFYVTSFYFVAGYTFFLRTSKEPSFEGFYQSRFSAKQKQLMKLNNFDLDRYNVLRKICCPLPSSVEKIQAMTSLDQAGNIC
ncbi:hypothetical protein OIU84_030021 [Salix udensis]|uniref:Calcium uniporter protein C-terminal domain-containing protein n=1 Tax=Salix udensis TaxID=889485 RepID=A0AAD6P7Z9_9ROSI|nr:hypothetical protein OIU84_030021 [Salix udensis]